MTEAVTVRRDGDTFQARLFWRHAAYLLDPMSPILRVGFESGPKSFDDIWVEYDTARGARDQFGEPLLRDHIQCKWHVAPDVYGHRQLIDPEFINANARSFLQRARDAQQSYAPSGIGVRFKLLTNWRVDREDALREMISTRSCAIRDKRLYATSTDGSRAGAVRKSWRDHLAINDEELRTFVRTLALGEATDSLEDLRSILDMQFAYVGLRRIPVHESAFPYDDLVFQWMAQGRLEFDRASFRALCSREGLLGPSAGGPKVYGVKSFEHPIDQLEERCDKVLNLVPAFDERYIRDQTDWSATLYPALKQFLVEAAREGDAVRLVLDAHASLAFAAGAVLNVKSGRRVELEQRSIGRHIWSADDRPHDPQWPTLETSTTVLDPEEADVVVAICLTHNVAADVQSFIDQNPLPAGKLIVLTPGPGPGAQSVACGRHAFELAQQVTEEVGRVRASGRAGRVHLFVAGPNAFTFFLGQHQPLLGPTTLYEFDFEGARGRSYVASLALPLIASPGPETRAGDRS